MSRGRPLLVTQLTADHAADGVREAERATALVRALCEADGEITPAEKRALEAITRVLQTSRQIHIAAELSHESVSILFCGVQGLGILGEQFNDRVRRAQGRLQRPESDDDDTPAGPAAIQQAA
jgi:hypothetical protein